MRLTKSQFLRSFRSWSCFRSFGSRVLNLAIPCRNTDVQLFLESLCFLPWWSCWLWWQLHQSCGLIKPQARGRMGNQVHSGHVPRALFIAFQNLLMALTELLLQTSSFETPTFMEKRSNRAFWSNHSSRPTSLSWRTKCIKFKLVCGEWKLQKPSRWKFSPTKIFSVKLHTIP